MPKAKGKKLNYPNEDQIIQAPPANSEDMLTGSDMEDGNSVNLSIILKELREFRKDNSQQLNDIHAEINKTNKRIEEAEERIDEVETRTQATEEAVTELLKLQIQLSAKVTELESRSRRKNIRIYGVKEGLEENAGSVAAYVERLLSDNLPAAGEIKVEAAFRAPIPKPPPNAPPRSIMVKLTSFRMKEEVLRTAWQKRGFQLDGKTISFDHDYAPEILKKRKEYAEVKAALKEKKIRFQTPFPAKLRVFYEEGTSLYGSAEEATRDMIKRGFKVTAIKKPPSLLEQVRSLSWSTVKRAGAKEKAPRVQAYQEKLQAFRRQSQDGQ